MSEVALVSVIALLGWLILVWQSGGLRNLGGKRKLTFGIIWLGAFVVAALVFGSVR